MGELQPRGDAAVVVGEETRISSPGREAAAGGARQREVQRGHVRAEDHLVGLAAEEPGRVRLGLARGSPRPAGSSRRPRPGSRWPPAARARSRRRPRRAPGSRPARRGTRSPAERREACSDRRRRRWSAPESSCHQPLPLPRARPREAPHRLPTRITTGSEARKPLPLPMPAAQWFDQRTNSTAGEGVLSFRVVRSAEASWRGACRRGAAGSRSAAAPSTGRIRCGPASKRACGPPTPRSCSARPRPPASRCRWRTCWARRAIPRGTCHHRRVTLAQVGDAFNITRIELRTVGDVPGLTTPASAIWRSGRRTARSRAP